MTICNECETVAHCTKHGCVPKVPAKDAAMKLAQKWQQTDWNTESPMSADFAVSGAHDVINALIDALREALAAQPAQPQQEPFGYFKAEPFGWTDCAATDEGAVALYEHTPAQQREPDLSGLKPSTQEVIKGWIEDGTFIQRAIGAMQEQEAENMRLEKSLAEQPAQPQQEPVAWMYDWAAEGEMVRDWLSSDYDEAHSPTMNCHNIRPLYTSPPAQRKPLTNLDGLKLAYKHRWLNNLSLRDAYILGIRDAEAAHGIKV